MAEDRPRPVSDGANTLESATLQMAMAFGQGTGGMIATPAAILLSLEKIRPLIEPRLTRWDIFALNFLEFSRGFGRLSAHRAVAEGRMVVTESDVRRAVGQLDGEEVLPMVCGCR